MNNIGDRIEMNNKFSLKLNFYINGTVLHKHNNIWNNIVINIWTNIASTLPDKNFELNNII
jgi:hypothetical protein